MSHYEQAVLDLLKDGPKQRKWLVNQLCPKIMSKKKLQKTLNELESASKVVVVSKRVEGHRNWTTWYVLPGQEYLLDVNAGRIIAAIERLRSFLFRPPTVDEVAVETGFTPAEAEKLAYKLAAQTGWFNPTSELIRDAREKLGEVLICAERMRTGKVGEDGKSEEFDYERYADDKVIVEEAKRFLRMHQKLLPTLTDDGVDVVLWPPEALRFLGGNHEPRDRSVPVLTVVPR
ncbi:hypothetical protein G4O51_09590 [Candidatus Bathyarchaeota archaeon A05DMB-2]|nr:hypothetical protein [Candidatus Bathyarchaeota archaeon A05DMB-2]